MNREIRFNKEPLTEIFNFRTTESLMGFLREISCANEKSINTTLNEILIPIEKKYKHQVRKPIIKTKK